MGKENLTNLVLKAQRGDSLAISELYIITRQMSRAKAKSLNRSIDQAKLEDVVSQTIVNVMRKLNTLKTPFAYAEYVRKALINQLINLSEQEKRFPPLEPSPELEEKENFEEILGRKGIFDNQNPHQEYIVKNEQYLPKKIIPPFCLDSKKSTFYEEKRINDYENTLNMLIKKYEKADFGDDIEIVINGLIRLRTKLLTIKSPYKAYKYLLGKTTSYLAWVLMNKGELLGFNGAIALFNESAKLWHDLKDALEEVNAIEMIGVCHYMLNDVDTAIDYYKKTESIIDDKKLKGHRKSGPAIDFAIAYTKMNELDLAEKNARRGLILWEMNGVEFGYKTAQLKLAVIQIKKGGLKNYNLAYYNIKSSLKDVSSNEWLYQTKGNIAYSQLYFAIKDQENFLKAIYQAEHTAKACHFYDRLAVIRSIKNQAEQSRFI
ncbi:MAG: tetratricopeptide repeat protein [bacterium]|nr:tetratricopeptide repeat protein [bacterium]